MVDLGDDGEPVVGETFDHPEFPERLGPVQLEREDPAGQPLQLLLGAGVGEAAVAYVVFEGEVVIVHPDRGPVVWDVLEALAIAGDVLELGFHVSLDALEIDRAGTGLEVAGLEHDHRTDVHVRRLCLERQERGVEIGQRLIERFHNREVRWSK